MIYDESDKRCDIVRLWDKKSKYPDYLGFMRGIMSRVSIAAYVAGSVQGVDFVITPSVRLGS